MCAGGGDTDNGKEIRGFYVPPNSPTLQIVGSALCSDCAGLSLVSSTKLKCVFEIVTETEQL